MSFVVCHRPLNNGMKGKKDQMTASKMERRPWRYSPRIFKRWPGRYRRILLRYIKRDIKTISPWEYMSLSEPQWASVSFIWIHHVSYRSKCKVLHLFQSANVLKILSQQPLYSKLSKLQYTPSWFREVQFLNIYSFPLQVKGWSRSIDLFSKDFIIVPINEHQHWYLAIICFPWLEKPLYQTEGWAGKD